MKKVLIISPHFPPVNAADMHRVRMSLPYFKSLGWEAEVLSVDPSYVEGFRDELLNETIPTDTIVHQIKAFPVTLTRKVGLGSLSMRCFFQMWWKGNKLIRKNKYDLIYFSTTAFHVCWLGGHWKRKFKVPFIIDLQDPWRNDFYNDKPKEQRPPKHFLFYQIHKYLEAATMPFVDGIISVSKGYLQMMEDRYGLQTKGLPMTVIPFGAATLDFELLKQKKINPYLVKKTTGRVNVVYVGAVTNFFLPILEAFFTVFLETVNNPSMYHFYFLGTSYVGGAAKKVENLASILGIESLVTEMPDRIPYFQALATLQEADILLIPGSLDVDYNASKVYNNILSGTPIFSIFHEASEVKKVIESFGAGIVVPLHTDDKLSDIKTAILQRMKDFANLHESSTSTDLFEKSNFTAFEKTKEQLTLFNKVSNS